MLRFLILASALVSSLCASGQTSTFTLKSNSIGGSATMKEVFNGFGCTGQNESPQLSWTNAPAGTKSFAITIHDPDAPTGSGWWHWLVLNIPASATELPAGAGSTNPNAMPAGVLQTITDFGKAGYGGPCPPVGHGPHRYIVTVYALPVEKLDLTATTNPAMVGYNLNMQALQKASILFYYQR
jgi:Raf kinase inhibitor-like YbhB/YbcL family protein